MPSKRNNKTDQAQDNTTGMPEEKLTFEEALGQLEKLVTAIEQGRIGLEESIQQYERGCRLIQYCRSILADSERKIERLSRTVEGQFHTEPFQTSPSGRVQPAEDDELTERNG